MVKNLILFSDAVIKSPVVYTSIMPVFHLHTRELKENVRRNLEQQQRAGRDMMRIHSINQEERGRY